MSRKRSRSKSVSSGYGGYVISKGDVIEHVVHNDESPESFFARFVSCRKPCVVSGFTPSTDLSIEALMKTAANEMVEVEMKPFGSGQKRDMRFADFCRDLSQGYMTTQREQSNIVSAPLQNANVPTRLPLSGNLSIANVNMWLGAAQETSTPLHVDFHDNFYLLIAGKKTFRVFSPNCAPDMKTNGQVVKVHSNGLVNFKGFPTNSDGSTEYALAMKALNDDDDEEAAEAALEMVLQLEREEGQGETMDPNHFSKLTAKEAAVMHECMTIELSAGQMLFLPAGFFHQVDSHVDSSKYHQAVNWWFHPADTNDFNSPYTTNCWN